MRTGKTVGRLSRELSTLAFRRWDVGEARSRVDFMVGVRTRRKGFSVLHVLLFRVRYPASSAETNVAGDTERSRIFTQSQDHSQGFETTKSIGIPRGENKNRRFWIGENVRL